jgi:hypothetical protein
MARNHLRSPLVEKLKIRFCEKAPNWLYVLVKGLYSLLFRRKEMVLLVPLSRCWFAIKGGRCLLVPSPKGDWKSFIVDPARADSIDQGDVVVEAEACIGATAISLAYKASRVIAIEPDPVNFKFLRKNVKLHGCENILLVKKLYGVLNAS